MPSTVKGNVRGCPRIILAASPNIPRSYSVFKERETQEYYHCPRLPYTNVKLCRDCAIGKVPSRVFQRDMKIAPPKKARLSPVF